MSTTAAKSRTGLPPVSQDGSVASDLRSPDQLRALGCNCQFGCRACGMDEAQMGNCPAWAPCPMGRARAAECPVHGTEDGRS